MIEREQENERLGDNSACSSQVSDGQELTPRLGLRPENRAPAGRLRAVLEVLKGEKNEGCSEMKGWAHSCVYGTCAPRGIQVHSLAR